MQWLTTVNLIRQAETIYKSFGPPRQGGHKPSGPFLVNVIVQLAGPTLGCVRGTALGQGTRWAEAIRLRIPPIVIIKIASS